MMTKSTIRLLVGLVLLVLSAVWWGCGSDAPEPRPETEQYLPEELAGIYLGIEREQVEQQFQIYQTNITDDGLQTSTRMIRDSVMIGIAFSYRSNRLATVTIWYDYLRVPYRIDEARRAFLRDVLQRNGPEYDRASFALKPEYVVSDLALLWQHPGCLAACIFSKPSEFFADTLEYRPYYQFSLMDSTISPFNYWPNLVIPAEEAERPYFREVDSLRAVVRESGR